MLRELLVTRTVLIVGMWLLLVAGIIDEIQAGTAKLWLSVALYYATGALTVLALWVEWKEVPGERRELRALDGPTDRDP